MGFKFKKDADIGRIDAEFDQKFLKKCFIDTGYLEIAMNTQDQRMFVLGRTGTGKTAMLQEVSRKKPKNVIIISPESLALQYISNNNIISFFEDIGVRLEPFYKLLWKQIFVLELIKECKHIHNEEEKTLFFQDLKRIFKKDKRKQKPFEYFEKCEDDFWQATEYRTKEITNKFEAELTAAAGIDIKKIAELKASGSLSFSKEEKAELIQRGQKVVNDVPLREINEIMEILSEDILTDEQKPFYILVDKLDEDWVDNKIRYKLIKAMLEAAKDFSKIKNAKVLISLRKDLMDRVFKLTRGSGHQQEKYDDLCLKIRWSEKEIIELLDERVDTLVNEQYTNRKVYFRDILPKSLGKEGKPEVYILERTFLRPRNAIAFVNCCIALCTDQPKITATVIKKAEVTYSRDRFRSIGDEWQSDYPNLLDFASAFLKTKPDHFKIDIYDKDSVLDLIVSLYENGQLGTGLGVEAKKFIDCDIDYIDLLKYLFTVFYKVGFIGLKLDPSHEAQYSYKDDPNINPNNIDENTLIYIHKAFCNILGVIKKK